MTSVTDELPRFSASVHITAPGKETITYTFDDDVPRQLMDEYQQLVGDGKARVTVSADMSLKDFGKGVSSMVSVSLTCNQDQQTIQRALGLAGHVARWFAKENRQLADNELQTIAAQQNPVGRPNFG